MSKTTEYKDKKGKNRIRHTNSNGNVTHSTTQGYVNIGDMKEATINACIEILENYSDELSDSQEERINEITGRI